MISEDDLTASRGSLASILLDDRGCTSIIRPPETPRPPQKSVKPRRASSIVRSPYLAPVVPYSLVKRTSHSATKGHPITKSAKSHQLQLSNGFPARKRTSSAKVTVKDLEEDFSGKNVFDLRDDLTSTKRTVSVIREERDSLRNELHKLKQLLEKKDKEIEDLITGGHVSSRDRTKVTSGNKADTLLTLSSLRHRLHSLERSIRDKESVISSLKADIKSTRLKELETEKEVYYEEILRLQKLAEVLQDELNKDVPQSKKQLQSRVNELERQLTDVTAKYKSVRVDREKLLKQLGHWKENGMAYPENDEHARQYMSLTQGAAVTALVKMELTLLERAEKIEELERNYDLLLKETTAIINEKDSLINDLKSNATLMEEKLSISHEENSKNKSELSKLQETLKHETTNIEKAQEVIKALQEELDKEQIAREHAQKLSQKQTQRVLIDEKVKTQSAKVIQSKWRYYQSLKKQNLFQNERTEIVTNIQSVIKAHQARLSFLKGNYSKVKNNIGESEIKLLHNVLQGHIVRKHFLANNKVT